MDLCQQAVQHAKRNRRKSGREIVNRNGQSRRGAGQEQRADLRWCDGHRERRSIAPSIGCASTRAQQFSADRFRSAKQTLQPRDVEHHHAARLPMDPRRKIFGDRERQIR